MDAKITYYYYYYYAPASMFWKTNRRPKSINAIHECKQWVVANDQQICHCEENKQNE